MDMDSEKETVYLPAPGILFTKVDDEMVLYDHNRGLQEGIYVLDDIGARIWQLLIEYGNKSAVVQHLLREYNIDQVTVESEIDIFIDALIHQGFLRTSKSSHIS